LRCVTANLNKAFTTTTTRAWLQDSLERTRPALVFGQELRLSEAEAIADRAGYNLIRPQVVIDPTWWMGSWVMVRPDLPYRADEHEYWTRFECYVAAGFVTLPGIGDVRVVSAHASPNLVSHADLATWQDDLPDRRTGPTGRPNTWRYSDLVLHAIGTCSKGGPTLAAGDFNESRHYDEPLGEEFFHQVHRLGLIDVTYSRWTQESPTHFDPTHPELQVDHVFATPDIDQLVVGRPELDEAWSSPESRVGRSDHVPVWFTLATSS
jgi:endonuclease/exonuclease/phosphatase family metal-dependent hydrolase